MSIINKADSPQVYHTRYTCQMLLKNLTRITTIPEVRSCLLQRSYIQNFINFSFLFFTLNKKIFFSSSSFCYFVLAKRIPNMVIIGSSYWKQLFVTNLKKTNIDFEIFSFKSIYYSANTSLK